MKVLQINSVYGFGSTGKIVMDIHRSCNDRKIDSYVIYSRNEMKGLDFKNVFKMYNALEFYSHVIKGLLFDKHGLYSKNNTQSIINKVEEIKPDIIHIHNIHGFYCNYPMLFEYLKDKKVIWTLHDCFGYTGFCAYYDYNQCDNWKKNKCIHCQFRNNYPYRILSNSKNNFALKEILYKEFNPILVTPSKWLKGEVEESMLGNKICKVINNSVNLNDFYKEKSLKFLDEHGLKGKSIYLAISNYWTLQKGYKEILRFNQLLDENEVMVVVGLSKQQLKKLPKNIKGFGRVSKEELRLWYSNASAFINVTLEDNYPTVNLEALACDLPVFTYRSGGSTEMVSDECYVAEKYNVDELLFKVRTYKDIELKKVKYQSNMIEEYIKLYESLYLGENI